MQCGVFERGAAAGRRRCARQPPGRRHSSVNMAGQEEELDFTSGRFNPARALATPDVSLPDPEAETYEDLYRFREAVHGQRLNVEQEIPGVSVQGRCTLDIRSREGVSVRVCVRDGCRV